jgi:ribosome maturation protein Sdo1
MIQTDGKSTFEVLTVPGTVMKYREGKIKDLKEVLVSDQIYKNATKGEKNSSEELAKVTLKQILDKVCCLRTHLKRGIFCSMLKIERTWQKKKD